MKQAFCLIHLCLLGLSQCPLPIFNRTNICLSTLPFIYLLTCPRTIHPLVIHQSSSCISYPSLPHFIHHLSIRLLILSFIYPFSIHPVSIRLSMCIPSLPLSPFLLPPLHPSRLSFIYPPFTIHPSTHHPSISQTQYVRHDATC